MMIFAAKTDKGKVRENNEDFFYASGNILIVADGMGGHNAGEVASKLATETAVSVIDVTAGNVKDKIDAAFIKANEAVNAMATGDRAGMGTTMDICIYENGVLYTGHIGDSRVYVIRNNCAEKITDDHSYVEMLIAKGEITKEEAVNYPMKNMITRAIGVEANAKYDFYETELKKNEKILLCSDGLTNMVSEERIAEIIDGNRLEDAVEILIKEANEAGGKDNITVIVAEDF